MEEGFMEGVHPFTKAFDFWLRSSRYEKDFLQVLLKKSQASVIKIFHISDDWKVVSVATQRGMYTPSFGVSRKPPSSHLKNYKFYP